MTLLWGDGVDETTLDNLRTCMWEAPQDARTTQSTALLLPRTTILSSIIAAFDVDAIALQRWAAGSDPRELEAATSLYAGEFLDGLDIESEDFQSWRRSEATR
jgi:hypothetical protein